MFCPAGDNVKFWINSPASAKVAARAFLHPRHGRAFTLVELLLVIVIMAITVGIAVPTFMRSYRGAKLRSSVRYLVMASRYARSIAVLQQVPVAMLLDTEKGRLRVIALSIAAKKPEDLFAPENIERTPEPEGEEQEGKAADKPKWEIVGEIRVERQLVDGVRITAVRSGKDDQELKESHGTYWVNYYPGGTCDAYIVEMVDDRGEKVVIVVDPMAATAKVDYEK